MYILDLLQRRKATKKYSIGNSGNPSADATGSTFDGDATQWGWGRPADPSGGHSVGSKILRPGSH